MTGSILYFNECANQQLLLTSVTIHAEILNTTSTDRSSLLQTFQGVSSNQTKLATNLTVIYIYQAIHHHFQNIYYTIIHTYITQTPGLLRIYLVIQFSINIEQIYHVYPSSFFFSFGENYLSILSLWYLFGLPESIDVLLSFFFSDTFK